MGGVALAHEYDFSERTQLGESTDAPPGSIEKFLVLKARAEAGLALWHPDDRCDYRGLYCGPGIGLNKTKNGTSVKVGGKHLSE